MLAGGHYSELIQLYKSNRNHRAALLLLNRLAEHPDSFSVPPKNPEQFGPKAIVDYLKVCMQNIMIELLLMIFVLNPKLVMISYTYIPTLIISLHVYP